MIAAKISSLDEAARVKLAASAEAHPEVLRVLAEDTAVTVRAAVAMNARTPMHADGALAGDSDERVRMLLGRKLAMIAPLLGKDAQTDVEAHALKVLGDLVEDEAVRVRAAIAEVVKEMPDAPKSLILALARDSAVPVSDPVIRLSPLLTPDDLLALLADPPTPESVMAIARRPHLNESVSDAIAGGADSDAIRALLGNRSAAIREATLDVIIARSAHYVEWHEPLVHRPALPAPAARALSDIVAADLLQILASRADLDPEVTMQLRRRLSERLSNDAQGDEDRREISAEQAMRDAETLSAQGPLKEDVLLRAAQRGEARLAAALLAIAANVSLAVVDRAASLRSAKGLISLCWKAGFSMRVGGPLQSLLAKVPPGSVLAAGPGGNFPLAVEEMRWQLEFLGRTGR